jgi:hypothetical protein
MRNPPLDAVLDMYRKFRGTRITTNTGNVQERFGRIYAEGIWKNGIDGLPSSGEGSSLESTEAIRSGLPDLLDKIGSKHLLDIGCGDFTWMQHVNISQRYTGIDIVDSVVKRNQANFGNKNRQFGTIDAISQTIPECDTVLCREILFHLSFNDGIGLIRNILSTNCNYLIATTDGITDFNSDIKTGDFRLLNLQRSPFSFPTPEAFLVDSAIVPGRLLAVWSIDQVRTSLS